jgi:hypothetical protein
MLKKLLDTIESGNFKSSASKAMKRVERIVANKSERISRWIDGVKADEFVKEVRQVMR